MKVKSYIITKRVKATNIKSAVSGEVGEIISIQVEKQTPPEQLESAIGFAVQDDEEDEEV